MSSAGPVNTAFVALHFYELCEEMRRPGQLVDLPASCG